MDPAAWRALRGRARLLYAVVLNAADGPGRRRDPAFHAAARDPRAAGVRLLGYVDTAYGRRSPRAVLTAVHRHRRWSGVGGVFHDQRATGPATSGPGPPVDGWARAAAVLPPGVRGAR
ncbi:spherulation-specific family 4 protein [Streptomyces buecherae]|uniref:spherulation-specific family 4 protein n=1 Tax=Streptomyces buecherae TaxID=2763006 RepID=UPI0037BABC18